MCAHRSKTTESAAGVVGATSSIHLSRPVAIRSVKPGRAQYPFWDILRSFNSSPRRVVGERPYFDSEAQFQLIIERNALMCPIDERYRSSPPTEKKVVFIRGRILTSSLNRLSKSQPTNTARRDARKLKSGPPARSSMDGRFTCGGVDWFRDDHRGI